MKNALGCVAKKDTPTREILRRSLLTTQKREIVEKLTDTMVSIEVETCVVSRGRHRRGPKRRLGIGGKALAPRRQGPRARRACQWRLEPPGSSERSALKCPELTSTRVNTSRERGFRCLSKREHG